MNLGGFCQFVFVFLVGVSSGLTLGSKGLGLVVMGFVFGVGSKAL